MQKEISSGDGAFPKTSSPSRPSPPPVLHSQTAPNPPTSNSFHLRRRKNNHNQHNGQKTIKLTAATTPFAGRLGGNQVFVLDRSNPDDAQTLKRMPDAAPHMSISQSFDLHSFLEVELWKAAVVEAVGTMMLVYLTGIISIQPAPSPSQTTATPSPLSNRGLAGAIIGGITNALLLALFIFSFGPVSGGHLNPTITLATFFARLSSFPRTVLYVAFQSGGASLAGLLLRASYGARDFISGGCYVDVEAISVGQVFAIEFVSTLALIFMSFGVGLDPRQKVVFGPALSPILVGVVLGVISFGTALGKPGYAGASANPARCLGIFVGSHFPTYHWTNWIADLSAAILHGCIYYLVPPGVVPRSKSRDEEEDDEDGDERENGEKGDGR